MDMLLLVIGSLFGGYLLGAFGGIGLTRLLTGSKGDHALEASMAGFLVTGPLIAAMFLAAVMSWYTKTNSVLSPLSGG
ncbi:MAG: hypothetical protein KDI56_02435 [Xanthomonadales bacterium]|nr:hypothetical protein [Xanthomonadales bacterium]MCB1636219.1 hypothetical protein [Xanthomonadales bacterium]